MKRLEDNLLRSSKYLAVVVPLPTKLERDNHLLRMALKESHRQNGLLRRNIQRIKEGRNELPVRKGKLLV